MTSTMLFIHQTMASRKIIFQGLRELLAISKQFGSIDAVKETASEPEQTAS